MNLPDYSQCVEINQLLIAMGVTQIPLLPEVRFEREIVTRFQREYLDPEDVKIGKKLIDSVIPVTKSDIAGKPGELLEYKGRKVVAYIRDQKAAVNFYYHYSGYKYHLCNCVTLQTMRDIGREHRYLATQRKDGMFEVHDLTVDPIQSGIVKMDLCKNCVEILKQKGIYYNPFNLEDYFSKYDSYTPKTIRKIEEVRKIQTYSPNQDDYSREYRRACNNKCQVCQVDCTEYTGILHLHHIDGNPANNERHNLQILCVDCHSKQPLHGHMLRNPEFKRQINTITQLRIDQGILTV
ncbi:HNH endonuclease [candidate division KSB1 bacterium]|nr:HNH endonuclease [candidate division KSB1 bacterium]